MDDKEQLVRFGAKLKSLREQMDLSQDDVVARCDVTKGNLSNIENGKKDFQFTTLLENCERLGCAVEDVI